jgi:hypothetical protein
MKNARREEWRAFLCGADRGRRVDRIAVLPEAREECAPAKLSR